MQSISGSYITDSIHTKHVTLMKHQLRIKAVLDLFSNNEKKKRRLQVNKDGQKRTDDMDSNASTKRNTIEGIGNENIEPSNNDSIPTSQRRSECINEFTSNEKILSASFFHIFLLGQAYKRYGSLMPKHQRHLMLQFTGIAGRCHEAIFILFNQIQRHGNVNGVNSVVRCHKESFNEFTNLVSNKKFRKVLQRAKQNPKGKTAKKIMKIVTPILTTGGNKTCFGSLERNDAVSKILAMCVRYGMPTLFLTVAIDDVNNFNR